MPNPPAIIVPARLASVRFPRKLLHRIRGRPIILWTAERIRRVAPGHPLYFAVDSNELEDCVAAAGFRVVRTDPGHASGTDRLAEANASIGAPAVINVQADEPLVTGAQIRALADGLADGAAMATLAVRFTLPEDFANPNQVKVVCDRRGRALYFSRSPIPFARELGGRADAAWLGDHGCYRHLGLYAYDAAFLAEFSRLEPGPLEQIEKLEQLRALEHGREIRVGFSGDATVGIDAAEDIAAFEAALDRAGPA
jgi:3-deoxy-manno-octulosonate cytidylyltransferase (CMP-KDO synthetase)